MKKRKRKRIKITLSEYEGKMEKIIDQCHSVPDTLILLLEEAAKYEIKDNKK